MTAFPWEAEANFAAEPAENSVQPQTVAAIDCGTNSIRLLILRRENGIIRELLRDMVIVRLGEGVDETRRLSPVAIARTVAAAKQYAQVCVEHQVTKLRFVATSASRDAQNSADFTTAIRDAIGVEPEVISGDAEARFSFLGAVGSLSEVAFPALVVDIGGGSTEFVVGALDARREVQIQAAYSADMGSVRLTEKFPGFTAETDTFEYREAVETAAAWVGEYLDEVSQHVSFNQLQSLIGVAGTVTTVTAKALDLTEYEPAKIHNARLSFARQQQAVDYMVSAPVQQKQALAYMPAGRADVIAAGSVIWAEIMRRVQEANPALTQVITSEQDILDGVALSLLP
ncbi:MAG: Ppx/GppA phosphatase family protein [Actinomycetaceae bacterium]|nr:Ppx/GppA phosphatase family protein [Actinomycetaceae bacterium]